MRILVIWASPNQDGLTAAAKERVLSGLKQTGIKTEVIQLNKCTLNHCMACGRGWGECRSKGMCVIQDDFKTIYESMSRADGIILITPVYWHDIAENLKALLDRLRRCDVSYSHMLENKRCLLIACAGGTGHGVARCLTLLDHTLANMKMAAIDSLPVVQFNKAYMLPALECAGRAFAEHILNV